MATQQIPSDPSLPLSAASSHPSLANPRPDNEIAIATRKSALARVQTAHISSLLTSTHTGLKTRTVALDTKGDADKQTPLHSFNAKALWTTELEDLLRSGEVDCIVHSLKDMPTQLPTGLALGAVTRREDSRDAVIIAPALLEEGVKRLADLPDGSVVGAGLRRAAQLKRRYPKLKSQDCRGNVGTRLAKVDAEGGEYAAIIVAAAGLKRLGLGGRINQYLTREDGGLLGAVGQGALGVEIREGDEKLGRLLEPICDERDTRACLAERSVMRTLEGGCSVPIGVETEWVSKGRSLGEGGTVGVMPASDYDHVSGKAEGEEEDKRSDELIMRAVVVSLDGEQAAEGEMRRSIKSREEADQFGWDMARLLVERGAAKILEEITLNRKIIQQQGEA